MARQSRAGPRRPEQPAVQRPDLAPLTAPPPLPQRFLIFGRTGWIGGLVGDMLKQQGATWEYATARLEDRAAVVADIERVSAL